MNIWFTADTHYCHKRIIELANRPFGSVEEMNEVMIERHTSSEC
jgi:calcineurin-like phosphoesterase family protein